MFTFKKLVNTFPWRAEITVSSSRSLGAQHTWLSPPTAEPKAANSPHTTRVRLKLVTDAWGWRYQECLAGNLQAGYPHLDVGTARHGIFSTSVVLSSSDGDRRSDGDRCSVVGRGFPTQHLPPHGCRPQMCPPVARGDKTSPCGRKLHRTSLCKHIVAMEQLATGNHI